MIWNMDNASPAAGGYMDLQTDGNRFDGTRGDTVIFSIWGSRSYEGPSCAQFPYESGGTGYSCRLPYPINVDRWYRLRAWKLSSIPAGVWWGAWILFESTGADIFIGKLEVSPPGTTLSGHANFSEYYGPPLAAPNLVPRSTVYWTTPAADQVSPGKYRFVSTFRNGTKACGTTGSVTDVGKVKTPLGPNNTIRIVQVG